MLLFFLCEQKVRWRGWNWNSETMYHSQPHTFCIYNASSHKLQFPVLLWFICLSKYNVVSISTGCFIYFKLCRFRSPVKVWPQALQLSAGWVLSMLSTVNTLLPFLPLGVVGSILQRPLLFQGSKMVLQVQPDSKKTIKYPLNTLQM